MLPLNKDCARAGMGMAASAHWCRAPVAQEKWQREGWERHGKDYLSLFLMPICHRQAEPPAEGSRGWVKCLRPRWDHLGLSGSAWPECLRTWFGRGPAPTFLSSGCLDSDLRGMQWLKQKHWALPEQFLSPHALLQVCKGHCEHSSTGTPIPSSVSSLKPGIFRGFSMPVIRHKHMPVWWVILTSND